MWWNGPEWLRSNPTEWLKSTPQTPSKVTDEERNVCFTTSVIVHPPIISVDRFSSFTKTVTSWVNRFIGNCQSQPINRITQSFPSVEELKQAENYWLLLSQKDHFLMELKALKEGKELDPSTCTLSMGMYANRL